MSLAAPASHPAPPPAFASPPAGHDRAAVARRSTVACDLALRHAGTRRVVLRYEMIGDAALPAVLVAGGISAGRHVAASDAFHCVTKASVPRACRP
jgi:homoserine O-acetyltransferase